MLSSLEIGFVLELSFREDKRDNNPKNILTAEHCRVPDLPQERALTSSPVSLSLTKSILLENFPSQIPPLDL